MTSWRPGHDGIVRPLIGRSLLAFWSVHDADLWVNQRLLVMRVLRSLPRIDKDTVRSVLDDLVQNDVLIRCNPTPTRTLYRLCSRFADPVAPGYAREIDELLVDPIPWVTAEGQFLRVGRRVGTQPRILPVATFPHHFTKHSWMRAWLHAAERGLFTEPAVGLGVVARAARGAPLTVLWQWSQGPGDAGPLARAGRAFETTRLWRATRRAHTAAPTAAAGSPAGSDGAEAAVRVLHELCGHEHLAPLVGRPLLATPGRILDEATVYRHLDREVAAKVVGVLEHDRPPGPAAESTSLRVPGDDGATFDPLLPQLEPRIRAMDLRMRATLGDHRRAWPRGLFSAVQTAAVPEARAPPNV